MATLINYQFLFSTDLGYFKALQIIGGKTIFDRYKLANAMVQKFEEKYRNFLAYPVKDGNYIEFHGIKSKYDTPQILSELQDNNAIKYQNIKQETLAYYNSKIEEFKALDKNKSEYLSDAIKSIDDRFVFCYDDKVILGAWGMQLRDNVREDINVIRKSSPRKDIGNNNLKEVVDTNPEIFVQLSPFIVSFDPGDNGQLNGNSSITKDANSYILDDEIPKVNPKNGYEFVGWNETPNGYLVAGDKEFIAQYQQIPVTLEKVPRWKRFWLWFTSAGCLKWLLWLLLALLLLLLFSWIFRGCNSTNVGGGALSDNDSAWLRENPSRGYDGGIYDPNNPYQPLPTPPGYEDVLPPEQGVLPPIDDKPNIIPGNPSIIGNRLNILMENQDKSILDLAKDFKEKYPGEKYKVVYYDDVKEDAN